MKRILVILLAAVLPLIAFSQSRPTGITPYTFQQAWKYFQAENTRSGEALLKKTGYSKAGRYDCPIGYNLIHVKACKVTMGDDGLVKKAVPAAGPGYSSYIEVGPGPGMDWTMSVTFLSSKGAKAFEQLLSQTGYKRREGGWSRQTDGTYFLQDGNRFSVSEAHGGF